MARIPEDLSPVEKEAIAKIQAVRSSPGNEAHVALLEKPERLMHNLILSYHGHTKLRFGPIAKELGVEMRTLERSFNEEFGKTMLQCHTEARLEFSKLLLRMIPPTKLSVIANLLGYDEVRDFVRFFRKQTHLKPSAWSRAERAKLTQARRSDSTR